MLHSSEVAPSICFGESNGCPTSLGFGDGNENERAADARRAESTRPNGESSDPGLPIGMIVPGCSVDENGEDGDEMREVDTDSTTELRMMRS